MWQQFNKMNNVTKEARNLGDPIEKVARFCDQCFLNKIIYYECMSIIYLFQHVRTIQLYA